MKYVLISKVVNNGCLEMLRLLNDETQTVVEIFPKESGSSAYSIRSVTSTGVTCRDLNSDDVRKYGEFLPSGVVASAGVSTDLKEPSLAGGWLKGLFGSK